VSDFAARLGQVGSEADTAIAALSEAVTNRDATIADLRTENARLETDNASLTVERDRLRVALEDCRNPVPPYRLQVGYCPNPNTPAEVNRLGAWSAAEVRRSYLPPIPAGGHLPQNPTFAQDSSNGLRTAHTFKCPVPAGGNAGSMTQRVRAMLSGAYDDEIVAYMKKSAQDAIFGCEHEPENDGIEPALWAQGQTHGGRLLRRANAEDGGLRKWAGNLMSSTDAADAVMRWYPGDGVWDILGWDGYNWPNRNPGSTTIPRWVEFEEIFTPDWTRCQELGVGFAIFEFGCRKQDLWSAPGTMSLPTEQQAARQADWAAKARTVMLQKFKPEVACYFHHDWWVMRENGHRALGGTA
jgi:hypothetical protein